MPAFTLYGFNGSSNADRVRLTLAEGGITDYEYIPLDARKGEHKSPEHLRRHPWGKIPAITFADGFTLYESRPICKYLATLYKIPLLPDPADAKATALFDQAQSVETQYFSDPAGKLSFEKYAKEKFLGLTPDESVVAAALKGIEGYFDIVDGMLVGEREYMAGETFGLVDVYYVPLVNRLFDMGYGEMVLKRANVRAWWDRCSNRPAVKKMLDEDREKVKKALAAMKS